jgi:ribonuclease HII
LIQSGIDEAGLGPILGPYCGASTSFEYNGVIKDPRKSCSSILSKEPGNKHLAVGDSKKIYTSGKLKVLEKTVLAFYELFTGEKAENAESFIQTLSGQSLPGEIPWYTNIKALTLPLSYKLDQEKGQQPVDSLKIALTGAGITIKSLKLTVQPAQEFNRLLNKTCNKATVCQEILSPLLKSAVSLSDQVVVDRQGGRRYYGDWLVSLFPGKRLNALRELKELSRYKMENCLIDFQVKADALCFETALASMFAKYSRELCMTAFNSYWNSLSPGIKKTAGYYSDGQRFIKDLQERGCFPENPDLLIRKK